MAVQTAAGSKIYISSDASTADSQTDFEGLTWTEIGEVVSIGDFGSEFQEITHTSISDRLVRKFKGAEDPGTIQVELGRDVSDIGQAMLKTALGNDYDYGVKIELNDQPATGTAPAPTTFYLNAKVMSYRTQIGSVDSIVSATTSLGISSRPIEVVATTGA